MRIDGLWAADEDTIEGEPGDRKSDEPPKPAKTGREWDEEPKKEPKKDTESEPEESARDTYDDIPCTD